MTYLYIIFYVSLGLRNFLKLNYEMNGTYESKLEEEKIQFLQGKLKHKKGVVNGKRRFVAKAFFQRLKCILMLTNL